MIDSTIVFESFTTTKIGWAFLGEELKSASFYNGEVGQQWPKALTGLYLQKKLLRCPTKMTIKLISKNG